MKRLLIFLLLIKILTVEIYTQTYLNNLRLNDLRFQNQTCTGQKYLRGNKEEDQYLNTVSVGIGEFFIPLPHRLNFMANFTVNLDLNFTKTFYLKIGLDIFDHNSSETKWILYLGPEFNFNILRYEKINLSIYTGAIGIAGTGQEGLGFSGSLFLNPMLKYEFKYFGLGIDLRNYCTLGFTGHKANYYFNPVIEVILKL